MIQHPSKILTFIVYNGPKAPKYFKINKSFIKALVLIIPCLTISFISLSFLYSMVLKNQVNELRSKEPKMITGLKAEKDRLALEIKALRKDNKLLTNKLSIGPSKESSLAPLGLFKTPIGLIDLRDKNLLEIKNIKISNTDKETTFSFDLANNFPNSEKLSGYLTVVQFQGNLLQFYPVYELGVKNLRLDFAKGESFSFSRFRPTITTFKKISKISARYKIYIFNRTGDLLAYRQVGPYNIN